MARDCEKCGACVDSSLPDPCLGLLPGVMFACCGHGEGGYVVFTNGVSIALKTGKVSFLPWLRGFEIAHGGELRAVYGSDVVRRLLDEASALATAHLREWHEPNDKTIALRDWVAWWTEVLPA